MSMKTRKLILFIPGLFITTGIFAQLEVQQGSNRDFRTSLTNGVTLAPGGGYTWTATNTSGTAITDTAAIAADHDSAINAVFGTAPATGRIDVYATSDMGCESDTNSIFISVVATLTYGATFEFASQNVCPANNHGATGDAGAVTVNFTGGNVSTFTYTLDGSTYTVTVFPAAASYSLNVTTAYPIAQSGTAHPVRITSVETSLMPSGSEPTHTINVSTAPDITNIQF
jgi:hypothetical protein